MNEQEKSRFDLKRKLAEGTIDLIRSAASVLEGHKNTLYRTVTEYNEARFLFIQEEFERRGKAWCTHCWKVVPTAEIQLIFTEGTKEISCGYEGGSYAHEHFSFLHRACLGCREQFMARHGWRGPWKPELRSQESYSAFLVEKREDGYWASRFGAWTKLPEVEIPAVGNERWEKIAAELGAPPRLEVKHPIMRLDNELIVHEAAAVPA